MGGGEGEVGAVLIVLKFLEVTTGLPTAAHAATPHPNPAPPAPTSRIPAAPHPPHQLEAPLADPDH